MDGAATDQFLQRVKRLRTFAQTLTYPRALLQNYYDGWVEQSGLPSRPVGFLYAVASGFDRTRGALTPPIDPADGADALALALAALDEDTHVLTFFGAAVSAGLFNLPDQSRDAALDSHQKLMEGLLDVLDDDVTKQVLPLATLQNTPQTNLQAHDRSVIWIDPGHVLPAIILARRRLCRIVRRNHLGQDIFLGTGFLVGPSAVMTNQHVVKDIDQGVIEEDALFCWFDFSETTGLKDHESAKHFAATNWHIASSPPGIEQPDGVEAGWWAKRPVVKDWLADVADTLDYAVIKLTSSPGLQRGWYDLEDLPDALPAHAIALHHPSDLDQTISFGSMSFSRPKDVRLFHQASTAGGSSGGLLLNQSGQPLGLHHMGITYDEEVGEPIGDPPKRKKEQRFMNVAVSLKHIRDQLKSKGAFDDIRKASAIAPVLGCIDGVHPIFGRTTLLSQLHEMWESNDKRILMVHFAPGDAAIKSPGKSFTIEVIKSLFRSPEHMHIVYKAGETDADAFQFASKTIESFAPDLKSELPAEPKTTTAAYVQTLVKFFGDKIAQRLSNRTVWLMIDDLDKHDVSDASGREFLATAYDQIEQMPNLRVVLIGLPENIEISGIHAKNVIRSHIELADISGYDALFESWFKQRSAMGATPIDGKAINLLARTIGSYAQQDEPLKAMANFVVEHMAKVADEFFGKIDLPNEEEGE